MNKKGSAVITAVCLGIILLFIIAAVQTFTSYRTQTVIQESKKVKALGLAEAGIELALGQLYNCANFETHKVKINKDAKENDKKLEWGDSQDRTNTLEANKNYSFSVDSGTYGTLSGTFGDGEFKVRVGNIPYEDDDITKTIDESKSYIKIESMGIYDKTVRKVIAIVNRRYPTREFLMYDGGVLSLIYGQTAADNKNVFATGHLYGHEGIELGRILMSAHSSATPGTTQELNDISAVMSGAGGIFIYSPIEAKFRNRSGAELNKTMEKNVTYPTNGTYSSPEAEKFGEMCSELKGETPKIDAELSNWVTDKTSGKSIPPTTPSFEQYKKQAQEKGKFYSASDSSSESSKYYIHSGWTKDGKDSLDVVYLDFGSNTRESKVQVPENGIIYSEKDVVIKGNPSKDITIVSEKNVFVAGDFNQAGNFDSKNNSGDIAQRYGFPQDYDSNLSALTANDYCQNSKDLFKEDAKAKNGSFKHHVSAMVIGKERVVYDHRSPVDCCENEIIPYLKYELAKAISNDKDKAKECLSPNNIQSLTITASSSIEGFNESIASFTKEFRIGDNNSKSDELKNKLKEAYESCNGSFNYEALDKMTLDVWQAYVDDFNSDVKGKPSSSGMEIDHGIYQLLFNLRKEMGSTNNVGPLTVDSIKDKARDYLFYPEMTTNAMFVSCGKQGNLTYCGPDVQRYYDEIGRSQLTSSYIADWYAMTGLVHRVLGSETYLRLYDVHKIDLSKNNYIPPTRRKIYDDTLPQTIGNNNLELTGFVVLSWQELGSTKEEFDAF